MRKLESCLEDRFRGPFPGKPVFDYWNDKPSLVEELDQTVVTIVKALVGSEHIIPYDFWMAGLRFFEWTNQSRFKGLLMTRVAAWQRSGWKRIIAVESFRLTRPRQTVPPIKEVLAIPDDDRRFVAKLLLATSEAADSPLGSTYRRSLKAMARDEESHAK